MTNQRQRARMLAYSALTAFSLLLSAFEAEATEALNLSPSMKVGDRMSVDIVLEESVETTVMMDDEVVVSRKNEARLALVGEFEVLEVDRWHRPTKRRLEVGLLVAGLEGEEHEQTDLLESGVAVLISQDTESSAAIATTGEGLPVEAERALRALFDAWSVVGVDEIFGTDRPSPEPDRWPVRADKALEALGLPDPDLIDRTGIRGEVRVVGRDRVDGVPCLRSQLSLEFPVAEPDEKTLAQGRMTIAMKQEDCRPTSGAPSPRAQEERYVTLIEVDGPEGATEITRQERVLQTRLRPGRGAKNPQALML